MNTKIIRQVFVWNTVLYTVRTDHEPNHITQTNAAHKRRLYCPPEGYITYDFFRYEWKRETPETNASRQESVHWTISIGFCVSHRGTALNASASVRFCLLHWPHPTERSILYLGSLHHQNGSPSSAWRSAGITCISVKDLIFSWALRSSPCGPGESLMWPEESFSTSHPPY